MRSLIALVSILGFAVAQSVVTSTPPGNSNVTLNGTDAAVSANVALNGTDVVLNACDCTGAVINNICYASVSEAVGNSTYNDTIIIGGRHEIFAPININTTRVAFHGTECDGRGSELVAAFDNNETSILQAVHPVGHNITIKNINFTSVGNNMAGGFRSLGNVTWASNQGIALTLENVHMKNMRSALPGVGVFVGYSSGFESTSDCSFENMTMQGNTSFTFPGGAAIAILALYEPYNITIRGTFEQNSARYNEEWGSKHSLGGAIYLDYMQSHVNIMNSTFRNNTSNQGSAIHVQGILKSFTIGEDCIFEGNVALNDGENARGGAVRLLHLETNSTVTISGLYRENYSEERGGVISTNLQNTGSTFLWKNATFVDNEAHAEGGVYSQYSSQDILGSFIIDGSCRFNNNKAKTEKSTLMYMAGHGTMSEADWVDGTSVDVVKRLNL